MKKQFLIGLLSLVCVISAFAQGGKNTFVLPSTSFTRDFLTSIDAEEALSKLGGTPDGGLSSTNVLGIYNYPIYSAETVYIHPRGSAEFAGEANYTAPTVDALGFVGQLTTNTTFNSIKANIWCANTNQDITLKIYIKGDTTTQIPYTEVPTYSQTITAVKMAHSQNASGNIFSLSTPLTLPSGYIYAVWSSPAVGEMYVRYYTNAASSPARLGFLLHSSAINYISHSGTSFYQSGLELLNDNDVTGITSITEGTNLLLNPSFEITPGKSGNLATNWLNTATYTVITNDAHTGTNAFALYGYTGQPFVYSVQVAPVAPYAVVSGDTDYKLSAWTKGDGASDLRIMLYNATGAQYLYNSLYAPIPSGLTSTTWNEFIYYLRTPPECTRLVVYFMPKNVNSTIVVDDVSLTQITRSITKTNMPLSEVVNNLNSSGVKFDGKSYGMVSTNTKDAIIEAFQRSYTPVIQTRGPRIVLPDTIYGVVGDHLQIFVRGMVEAQDPYYMPYKYACSVGNAYPRYWDYSPTNTSTNTFTFSVLNPDYTTLSTKSVSLKVVNPTNALASTKHVLCLGDSLTVGQEWPTELLRRLTGSGGTPAGLAYSNIVFVGDETISGYSTNASTGYGGWTMADYIGTSFTTNGHVLTGTFDKDKSDVNSRWSDGSNTWYIEYAYGGLKIHGTGVLAASGTLTHVSGAVHTANIVYTAKTDEPQSPIWQTGGTNISFTNWVARNSYPGLDAVYVLLGWNSTGGVNGTNYDTYMSQYRTFLDKLHTDYPSCLVRIVGIQVPSVNGGLGHDYGSYGSLSEYYGMLISANNINIAYQNLANEDDYSSWVRYIGVAPQFDSENNMSQEVVQVNTRNAAIEYRGSNGVHPATEGYYQIADAIYREFCATFLSN